LRSFVDALVKVAFDPKMTTITVSSSLYYAPLS